MSVLKTKVGFYFSEDYCSGVVSVSCFGVRVSVMFTLCLFIIL